MTIDAAINIRAFDANVRCIRTAVAPPLGWPKQSDDRSTRSHRDVGWPSVAANINACAFRERIKTFERQTHRKRVAASRRPPHNFRELFFTRAVRYQGSHSITGPQQVAQRTEPFRAPQLRRPPTRGIEYGVI